MTWKDFTSTVKTAFTDPVKLVTTAFTSEKGAARKINPAVGAAMDFVDTVIELTPDNVKENIIPGGSSVGNVGDIANANQDIIKEQLEYVASHPLETIQMGNEIIRTTMPYVPVVGAVYPDPPPQSPPDDSADSPNIDTQGDTNPVLASFLESLGMAFIRTKKEHVLKSLQIDSDEINLYLKGKDSLGFSYQLAYPLGAINDGNITPKKVYDDICWNYNQMMYLILGAGAVGAGVYLYVNYK